MDSVLLLAIGAMIAGIIGGVRTYYPELPSKYLPLLAIGISIAFLAVGINSGEIPGGFTLRTLLDVLSQAVTALGIGRGATAVAGRNDDGVPRLAAAAAALAPYAPPAPSQLVVPAASVPRNEPVIRQDPPPTSPAQPSG